MNYVYEPGQHLQMLKESPHYQIKIGDIYEIVDVSRNRVQLALKHGNVGWLTIEGIDNPNEFRNWATLLDPQMPFDSSPLDSLI